MSLLPLTWGVMKLNCAIYRLPESRRRYLEKWLLNLMCKKSL